MILSIRPADMDVTDLLPVNWYKKNNGKYRSDPYTVISFEKIILKDPLVERLHCESDSREAIR
jgi:hypothetical protein